MSPARTRPVEPFDSIHQMPPDAQDPVLRGPLLTNLENIGAAPLGGLSLGPGNRSPLNGE